MKLDTGTELPEKFVLTKEFKDTYDLINRTDTNLFITGKAGSGKSTLLEYFRQNTNKNFATLAFQGITAIKAKGQTIHSFFKLGPHFLSKDDVKDDIPALYPSKIGWLSINRLKKTLGNLSFCTSIIFKPFLSSYSTGSPKLISGDGPDSGILDLSNCAYENRHIKKLIVYIIFFILFFVR